MKAKKTKKAIAKTLRANAKVYAQERNFPSDLECMCALVSRALASAFRKHGYPATFVEGTYNGDPHCWVVSDKTIWDLTLTQFVMNADPISTFPVQEYTSVHYYQPELVIQAYQDQRKWPREQRPSPITTRQLKKGI